MKLSKEDTSKLTISLLVAALFIVIFNSYQISQITGNAIVSTGSSSSVIPTGTPKIYGQELQISYDDISPNDQYKADLTIRKLAQFDETVTLTGNDNERYINILYILNNGLSCEYCCGARSIIFENGQPACGCAHSFAMRGLSKYLITQHGNEYTDEEILEEVGKWKVLFFPSQLEAKAAILQDKGIEVNYVNLASNKYRGIEAGSSAGGMVGGC